MTQNNKNKETIDFGRFYEEKSKPSGQLEARLGKLGTVGKLWRIKKIKYVIALIVIFFCLIAVLINIKKISRYRIKDYSHYPVTVEVSDEEFFQTYAEE